MERSRSRERRTGVIDAARRWKAGAGAGHTLATDIKSARVRREKIGYRVCVKRQAPKASVNDAAEGMFLCIKTADIKDRGTSV